jgi:prevent-host-death family protein
MPIKSQKEPPELITITSTDLQRRFGSIVRQLYKQKQHIIVERDGLPVMVILPMSDYEALTQQ